MSDYVKIILMTILLIVIVVFGPFLSIWALNVLFSTLAIPYTLETWAASLILCSVVSRSVITKKD